MLGGYGAFWLFALRGLDPFASLAVVIPAALVAGVILYWALFGWVVRAPEETRVKNSLLVGFGLALALEAAAVRLFTADERSITTSYAGAVLSVGGLAVPVDRPRVDAEGAHRRRPRGTRLDARHLRRGPRARPGRGGERCRVRWPLSRGRGARHLLRRPRGPPARAVRPVSGRRSRAVGLAAAIALAAVPLVVRRDDVLNFLFLVLLSVTLAESWNIVAGYAGQVNLGHAAFFGLGALTTRALWVAGAPVLAAMVAGAAVAVVFALLVGAAAFRLRGAYFAIGTLALGEILRITVGNVRAEISTLPAATIAGYRLAHRYYLALALAAVSVVVVAALGGSRLGLGMRAIREDEEAAEASGVGALRLKLLALSLSTALAGLAGGLFAYYHISYYPAHPFSPTWTFDSLLITFIGGVGTVHGPLLGAVFYVFLKEFLAIRWVDFHLLIFGALFVAIVLLLPGGLVEAAVRLRALTRRPGQAC